MRDYFKEITKRTLKEATRIPSVDSSLDLIWQRAKSKHPLRTLGISEQGTVILTEEDRESHIHILGATREGKSKLLELLIRQDIQNGYGACLLDPTAHGETMYKVLRYCAKIGYEKVIIIDPHDAYGFKTVATINPIHYNAPASAVVGGIMDSMRVLWGQTSFVDTPRIQKYLPAVITALHAARMTLAEVRYFMGKKIYELRRQQILEALHPYDLKRVHLEEAFYNAKEYDSFMSTINRLEPLIEPTMEVMFGSNDTPIDFMSLVSQGYLILVNLDPEGLYGQEHQRLLGTMVIAEILYAINRLTFNGWKGRYYFYVDECGDYATDKVKQVLDKKAKLGVTFTLSHQGFDQLPQDIEGAIRRGTKIKVLFSTLDSQDRDKMLRLMGYGGKLQDRDVSHVLSQLKKQHCAIKINKQPPVIMRVTDLPDVQVSTKVLADFKTKIYNSHPFYREPRAVREEINHRFDTRTHSQSGGKPDGPQKHTAAGSNQKRGDDGNTGVKTPPVESGRKPLRRVPPKPKPAGVVPPLIHKRPQDAE